MGVMQLLEDASAGQVNRLFPCVCDDFIVVMTQTVERVAAVCAEYAETKLLSEEDAIVLVQAFLIFTGNLLKPPNEMAIFFGTGANVDAEMDVRHAWVTLLFTEAGDGVTTHLP